MTSAFISVVPNSVQCSLLPGREVLAYKLMMYVRFANGTIVEMRRLAIPPSHLIDGTRTPQLSSSHLFENSGHNGDLGRLQLTSPYASLFGLRAINGLLIP